ncbi:MAG: FAD-dependent oxidoreductase [Acidimicrobiales bacterium]|jgi:D-amino-acid dehydrogenase
MTAAVGAHQAPSRVIVVGAGMVGLSCAWSLQDHGIEVCVLDRERAGAGSSWGNAGFVSPALAVPLPEPSILRYGVGAVLRPGSPVQLLLQTDPQLLKFMAGLVRHCTADAWRTAMLAYRPLNERVFDSYQRQRDAGVDAAVVEADVLSCFEHPHEATGLLYELEGIVGSGQPVSVELLTSDEAHDYEPHLSERVTLAVKIRGQRYLTPSVYVGALADHVRKRGGEILEQTVVTGVERRGGVLVVRSPVGDMEADAVVLASGAWLSALARPHGVRVPVYAGRGYSFSLPCAEPLKGPVHFPSTRVAATPQGDRVRLAGIMEFGSPDAAARPDRITSMVRSVRPLLDGVDWDRRADDWMGPRPLTTDGLPLVGESRTPGLFVAGGHGMWGVTMGPLTGWLLADRIATGVTPSELRPLDPCR